MWGRKADGKTGWVTPKAGDANNEGAQAPAMPVAAVAPPVAQVVPMRALRKQFSGLTGVSGAFSGKDKEEELRQERAKLEADKLAFERQKLEAERRKLEEERARICCGGGDVRERPRGRLTTDGAWRSAHLAMDSEDDLIRTQDLSP